MLEEKVCLGKMGTVEGSRPDDDSDDESDSSQGSDVEEEAADGTQKNKKLRVEYGDKVKGSTVKVERAFHTQRGLKDKAIDSKPARRATVAEAAGTFKLLGNYFAPEAAMEREGGRAATSFHLMQIANLQQEKRHLEERMDRMRDEHNRELNQLRDQLHQHRSRADRLEGQLEIMRMTLGDARLRYGEDYGYDRRPRPRSRIRSPSFDEWEDEARYPKRYRCSSPPPPSPMPRNQPRTPERDRQIFQTFISPSKNHCGEDVLQVSSIVTSN